MNNQHADISRMQNYAGRDALGEDMTESVNPSDNTATHAAGQQLSIPQEQIASTDPARPATRIFGHTLESAAQSAESLAIYASFLRQRIPALTKEMGGRYASDAAQEEEMSGYLHHLIEDLRWIEAQGQALPEKTSGPISPKETDNARDLPAPTKSDYINPQIALFQEFLANTDRQRAKLSNTVDLWDSVPRYSMSRQEMGKQRIVGRFLEKRKTIFRYRNRSYTCVISPARVGDLDGIDRDFYPAASEELVEDALRKLAVERGGGYYDGSNHRSGVSFSLYELREEMRKQGHARTYPEIVQSLNILSHCVIDLIPNGEGEKRITSACLPLLAAVSAKQLEADPESRWAVQFHPLVTASIDEATHRQYNYQLMMSLSTQLARWIHKQLVIKYTFADASKPFEMRYSTIKRDSSLLEGYSRERAAIEKLVQAFTELKEKGVIERFTRKDEAGPRRKLLDVVFTVRASGEFIAETKAANNRSAEAKRSLASRLTPG